MATKTGSIGNSSGWQSLQNPISLGISMDTNEYPSGTVSFALGSGKAWYNGVNAQYTMTVYLCDSAGNNRYKLFDISSWDTTYWTNTSANSANVSCPNLKGKALYLVATMTGNNDAYTYYRGSATTVSVNTTLDVVYLTVNSANTNMGTVSGSGNHAPGVAVNISATAKTGYHFTGWACTVGSGTFGSTTSASTTFTTSGAATVVASFAANNYTVTVNGSSNSWAYGSQHTLNAPTAPTGKQFSSWSMSGSGSLSTTSSSTTVFTVGAGNATVTTNYSWIYRTISKSSNPSAGGTVTLGATSAHYGEVISVSASPATGYQLSSWSTNVSGVTVNNNKFTMPNQTITITGNFSKIGYNITCNSDPVGGGTPSPSKSPANYGDTITLSPNRASGYLFDGWTSGDVTITNNTFTMPAKAVTITGHYHIGRSTATVDKTNVTGGDTIALTVVPQENTFYHKYKLSFGLGMETSLVTMTAGTTSASIYVPLEWSKHLKTVQKTGTLTVQTYEADDTYLGEYVIDNITYTALDGVIPKLQLRRVDDINTPNVKGLKAKYVITAPANVGLTLTCDEVSVADPPKTGLLMPEDVMTIATTDSIPVEVQITFGNETFTLVESVPSIWLLSKSVG